MPKKKTAPLQSLADRLSFILTAKRLSQAALADTMGVSQANVSRWLGGSVPETKSAVALSERLDISLEWLLYGAGTIPSSLDAFILEIRKHRLPTIEESIGKIKLGPLSLEESAEHLAQLQSIRQSLIGLAEHAEKTGEVAAPSRLDNPAKYITRSRKFIIDERGNVSRLTEHKGVIDRAEKDAMLLNLLSLPAGASDQQIREAHARLVEKNKKSQKRK